MTRLVFISDTHNQLHKVNLPDGDILVHCGDATGRGTITEVNLFATELYKLRKKYKHIVFTPGNHDFLFEKDESLARTYFIGSNIHILIDQFVEIDGIKFYGSPYQPRFCDWAFNVDRGPLIAEKWKKIPEGVDVLITHGPPMHILDFVPVVQWFGDEFVNSLENVGCQDLFDRVMELKPKIHAFGHIHYAYGVEEVKNILFINAANCNEDYKIVNNPVVVDFVDGKATLVDI